MLQYVYCGTVDISLGEVEAFRELLDSFKIDFAMNDEDDEDRDDDSEPELIEPPPPEVIDVEEQAWSDSYVKVELKEDDSATDSINQAQEQLDELEAGPAPVIQRVRHVFKSVQKTPNKNAFPEGKISVKRVVPSKQMQQIMSQNPKLCPFCGKHFKTSKHRNEHVKYCFDNPDRIVSQCPLCNKSVCDPYYLRKHIRLVHGNS